MKEIYLDNNATTKVDEAVFEEMRPYFCELYGNPSSMHFFGGQVQQKVDEARRRVAALLGASPDEIIFTACGTESDNAAIRSALEVFPEKRHIITSRVEHPAVLTQCREPTQRGYRVTEIGVDGEGRLDLDGVEGALDDRHRHCVAHVCQQRDRRGLPHRGGRRHCRRPKGRCSIPMPSRPWARCRSTWRASNIDMLSLSGHKLHAPKGVGVLYLRRGTPFRPFMVGGHQEKSRRGRHRECRRHHRSGQGMRTCRAEHGDREHQGKGHARPPAEQS